MNIGYHAKLRMLLSTSIIRNPLMTITKIDIIVKLATYSISKIVYKTTVKNRYMKPEVKSLRKYGNVHSQMH